MIESRQVSRQRLIQRILKNLGVHQAGQDLAPEDVEAVDEDLNGHLAAIDAQDIYRIGSYEYFAEEAYTELANYLANEYAQVFGLEGEELARVTQMSGPAETALRRLNRAKATGQTMRVDYF